MEQVLLVVQVLLAVALIGMVLIQRSDSDGFGLSGGSGNNLLSGRSTANLMTRTTAILAALFIMNSLALSVLAAHRYTPSIVDSIEKLQAKGKNADGAPSVPLAGETTNDKAPSKKPDVSKDGESAPSVPAADADATPAPVVKKSAKKAAAPESDSEPATDGSDSQ